VDGAGGLVDGDGEQGERGPGRRGSGRSGRAVEAKDGVEVDDAAPLVLGDLGKGNPDLSGERLIGEPGLAGECPAQGDGEAPPQFRGTGVEQHRPGVVVAVRAERFAKLSVVTSMPLAARQAVAMWAGFTASARSAPQDSAVFLAAQVHRSEGWCGEGGEYARMLSDGGGDALAAGEPGTDELEGVGPVDLGTGSALGSAAGLAGDRQDAAGLVDGGIAVQQFAGGAIDVIDAAAQQNRLQASPGVLGACEGGVGGQRWCFPRRALAGGWTSGGRPVARRV